MKTTLKKILPLSLLLLAGCWDSGCCKKNKTCSSKTKLAQVATPKERCNHAGCTHDHSKDAVAQEMPLDTTVVEQEIVTENQIDTNEK